MRIGDLNKQVILQHPTKAADTMSGLTVTWTTAATIWAAIWPVSASESIQAGGQAMTVTHRIRIRYRSVIRAGWRISFGNKYYNIVSIIDQNMRHKVLDLLCKEAA